MVISSKTKSNLFEYQGSSILPEPNGMDIKTLSEILGHSNVSITLNRYSHSMIEHKVKAINEMYKIYAKQKI